MQVTFLLWKYRPEIGPVKYTSIHVNAVYKMIRDNVTIPHRVVCITDDPEGVECETYPLWPYIKPVNNGNRMDCYRRLKVFHPPIMADIGGDRFCSVDLDCVILSNIDHLLTTGDDFIIMDGSVGKDGKKLSTYNGGFWVCDAGARPQFAQFDYSTDPTRLELFRTADGRRLIGSDQAFMAMVSPDEKVFPKEAGLRQVFNSPRVGDCSIMFFAGTDNIPWGVATYRSYPEVWHRYLEYSAK